MAPTWFSWVLGLAGATALGCDGDGTMAAQEAADEGEAADDDAEAEGCATEMRADRYALGLRKEGAASTVEFVEALPAPPERGDNTWRVRVTDPAGEGMPDLAMAVTPFMPDHQHGTTVEVVVTQGTTAGEYVLAPVNLFMPGLWEVTLAMTTEDGTEDEVVFRFCVDP